MGLGFKRAIVFGLAAFAVAVAIFSAQIESWVTKAVLKQVSKFDEYAEMELCIAAVAEQIENSKPNINLQKLIIGCAQSEHLKCTESDQSIKCFDALSHKFAQLAKIHGPIHMDEKNSIEYNELISFCTSMENEELISLCINNVELAMLQVGLETN
ncbi:hypothetical protein GN278_11060 [Rhodobacteraceae bacterium Araon29]